MNTSILRRAALLCGVWALGASQSLPAAQPNAPKATELAFRTYGREAGLENIRVNLLLQDREGFLWVGTDDGLFRYDGHRFDAFGAPEGLPSTDITALHVDPDGRLWVGTSQGLCRQRLETFEAIRDGLPDGAAVEDLADGPGGQLWVATRKGLFAGTVKDGFRPVAGWTEPTAFALCSQPDRRRVWAIGAQDLWTWEAGTGWKVVDADGPAARDGLEQVLDDSDGRVWIRSTHSLWVLQPGDTTPRLVPGVPPSERRMSRLFLDSQGVLWAPNESGVAYFEGGRWTQIGPQDGLPTDRVRAVLVDREGSLWVGSHGLFRIIGRGAWRSATPREGLPVPVWAFIRDHTGELWVGTQNGLTHHTGSGWQVVGGTAANCVRTMFEAPDGSIYMAGEPAKVLRWDRATGRIAVVADLSSRSARIMHVLHDPEGRLWVGARRAGLLVGREKAGRWDFAPVPLPAGTARENVYDLLLDRGGRLWAGGDDGLACLVGGRWVRFTTKDGLLDNSVTYVVEAPSGDVWVAYYDTFGVSRVRLDGDRLQVMQSIGPAQGLASADIYLIGLDAGGRLWVGSDKGVDVVENPESSSQRILHFGVEDGLVDEDTDAMAFLADPNGDVWIGARGGLGQFVAARYATAPQPPTTAITLATLGNHTLLNPTAGPVRAAHSDNTLAVRFSALSFLNEAAVRYQVRLVGLEKDWTAIDAHEARYSGLAPGTYRWEVRSRIGRGGWGPVAALSFEILPPWWQTTGARIGALLALVGIVVLYGRVRTATLRRRAEELETQVGERTRELAGRTADLALAGEALRREQEFTRALLENMVDGVVACDAEGKPVLFNRAAREWHGFDPVGIPNETWTERYNLFFPDGVTPIPADSLPLTRACRGEVLRDEGMVIRPPGQPARHVLANCAPVRDESGRKLGAVGVMHDITDRKRLEDHLLHSQRMEAVGSLAGGVAHDFNNLLQAMLSQIQFVRSHAEDAGKVTELAQELEAHIQHGASLTRQLLLFSRRETVKLEQLDLNEPVRDATSLLRRLVRANIALVVELAGGALPVKADRGQIQQVVTNLTLNASDAMPDGGTLRIRTGDGGGEEVWLCVEDSGHGMSETIRDRIFDPFFTTKAATKGTGLGLSVVHGIVTQHGGRIEVESAVGIGTTVRVFLPRVSPHERPAAEGLPPRAADLRPGQGERILIVEDEAGAREGLCGILTSLGYDAVAVASGEEAVALPSTPRFDLLLTDLMLPGLAGPQLAAVLKDRWPGLAVILMSGYTEDEVVKRGVTGGLMRFLQKPFGMGTLAREVRAAIDERSDPERA